MTGAGVAPRPRAAAGGKAASLAPVFAALGDETRLKIVARLCAAGPLPIVRLTEGAPMTRQAITKHLNALARAGLVRGARDGRERVWEVRPKRVDDVRRYLGEISRQWDEAIGRLRAMVEE